jgi:hypothetical protein
MDVRITAATQLAPLLTATFLGNADEQLRGGLYPQLGDALLSLDAASGLRWRVQETVMHACAGCALSTNQDDCRAPQRAVVSLFGLK